MPSTHPELRPLDLDPASGLGRQAAKWGAGLGTSALILLVIAHVQLTDIVEPPPPIANLQTVVLDEPPPPPPEITSREPPPPTLLDLEPLPSDNEIKIAVAPLTYELPLPEATPKLEISLDAFRPKGLDAENNPDHIFQFKDVDQNPVIIHRQKPDVPNSVISKVADPRVVVSMVVTRAGSVRNIEIARSSGSPELDRLVIDALANWRFRPALRRGAAVNCLVIQSIVIKPPRGGSPFSL